MSTRKKWKVITKLKYGPIVTRVITLFCLFENNWNTSFLGIINFVVFGNTQKYSQGQKYHIAKKTYDGTKKKDVRADPRIIKHSIVITNKTPKTIINLTKKLFLELTKAKANTAIHIIGPKIEIAIGSSSIGVKPNVVNRTAAVARRQKKNFKMEL